MCRLEERDVGKDGQIFHSWKFDSASDFSSKDLDLYNFSGHSFLPRLAKKENVYYIWVYVLGGTQAATRFK